MYRTLTVSCAITFALGFVAASIAAQESSDAEFHFRQGEAFLQSKELEKAVSEFKRAIRKKPHWAEAHFKLGQAYAAASIEEHGSYEKRKAALQAFQESVRLRPDWAEAHYELGRNLSDEAAISAFKEAIRLNPEMTEAHEELGIRSLYKQDFAEAINRLLRVVELDPDRPRPHKLLGLAYLILDQKEKAAAELQILQSLDAEMAEILRKAIDSPTKPGFGIERREVIKLPKPVYPNDARRRGIFGTVSVEIEINENGQVTAARAISGPMELHRAAEAAARKALFQPTTLSGHSITIKGVVSFNFHP